VEERVNETERGVHRPANSAMTAERGSNASEPPLDVSEGNVTSRQVWAVFFLFVVTDVLLSVDSGALPVALPSISARFHLTRFNQGTLGALSPAGFALATTYVGVLLQHRSPRNLLTAGLGVTAFASAAFAAAPTPTLLYLSRFCYGVAYAVFFVFAPVWITMYAPESRATSWISMIQAGAPIGAVAGLVCSGLVAGSDLSWRLTFFVQAAVIALCMASFSVVPSRFIDGRSSSTTASSTPCPTSLARHLLTDVAPFSPTASGAVNASHRQPESPGARNETAIAGASDSPHSLSPRLHGQHARLQQTSAELREVVLSSSFQAPHGQQPSFGDSRGPLAGPVLGGDDISRSVGDLEDERTRDARKAHADEAAGGHTSSVRQRHDTSGDSDDDCDDIATGSKPTLMEQLRILASNQVFVFASLALGFLTFTVEGIRYWVVLYRTEVFHEELSTVVAAFTLVSSTAPILGMFFGGGVIDKFGGYRTKEGVARSMRILMAFSLCAGPSAALILIGDLGTKSSLRFFSFATWLLLFFGGAHVAPLTGIMIAAVSEDMRPVSSAVSLLVNHIVGFFFAPFGIGILANVRGIKLGFQAVICASAVAITFGFLGWIAAEKDYRAQTVSRIRRRRERQARSEDGESSAAFLASP
jgi:MFS family permease